MGVLPHHHRAKATARLFSNRIRRTHLKITVRCGLISLPFIDSETMSITRVDLDRSSCPATSRPTTRCQPSALELVQGR
jgi:hypothetical protein